MEEKIFLLIDDDKDDRNFFKRCLNKINPQIGYLEGVNGKSGLETLESNMSKLPDVIFLDINMPVMTGWECLQSLKQNKIYSDIPVVMFSTSGSQRDINMAFELGACAYCVKPDEPSDVLEIIKFVFQSLNKDLCSTNKKNDQPGYFQFPI